MTHGQELFADLPDKIMSEAIVTSKLSEYLFTFVKQNIRMTIFFLTSKYFRITMSLRQVKILECQSFFYQAGYQNSNLSFVKQDIRIIVFFLSNINLRMTIILSSSKGFRMRKFLQLKI